MAFKQISPAGRAIPYGAFCVLTSHTGRGWLLQEREKSVQPLADVIGGHACRDTLQEGNQIHSIQSPLPVASLGWSNTGIIPYRGDKKNYGRSNLSTARGVISCKNAQIKNMAAAFIEKGRQPFTIRRQEPMKGRSFPNV